MASEKEKRKTNERTMLYYFPKIERKRDWRPAQKSLSAIRNKARKEGRFTDVKFVMGKGDQRKEFHAHKVVLACASPVFQCMFYGPMAEKSPIIETDDDPEAFDMLLNYIYGTDSDNEIKSLMTAWKFFMIGDKYLVHNIERKAKNSMKDIYLSDNDFWDVIQEKNINDSCPLIRDKLNFFIMDKTDVFFASAKWLNAPETIVQDILQMDKLNIDEYSLLIEVTRWVYHNKKLVTSEILIQYYKYIRFSILSSYELMRFIEKYPKALEAETYLEILRHVHGNSGRNLPEWCSTSKVCRRREYTNYRYSKHYDWR